MNITCPQCQHSVRDRDRFKPKLFWVCPQCAQEYGLRKTAFDQEYMQEAAKALQTEVTEAGRRYWRKWESNDLVGSLLGFAILGGIAISLSLYLLSIYEDLSPELFELSLESALAWALLGFFSFVILVLGSLALVVLFSWLWTPDITFGSREYCRL
jgi:ribosomal protein L37AE/L43A